MFEIEKYKLLIANLKNKGLVTSTNWHDNITSNTLFLRHDIDVSVEFAHKLAAVEFDMGIKSTYFFMFTSNMYNLISLENQKMVNEIAKMGHKISIHFDPTVYNDLKKFEYEKYLFENIFNVKIDIISIHRPGFFLENNNITICGISQTYNDIYFKNMKYISDSAGRDIIPLIEYYLKEKRTKGLHLLTHPIWWVGKGSNVTETFNFWRKKNLDFITSEIRLNCKTYRD